MLLMGICCWLFLLGIYSITVSAVNPGIETSLKGLDVIISQSKVYEKERESRINRLKNYYVNEILHEKRFDLCYSIIEEYKSYNSDSAMIYIEKNLRLAQLENNPGWKVKTLYQQAFTFVCIGLFHDARNILTQISKDSLSENMLIEYYRHWEILHGRINKFLDNEMRNAPSAISHQLYRDSLLMHLPPGSLSFLELKSNIEYLNGNYEESVKYAMQIEDSYCEGSREHAMFNYYLSKLYLHSGWEDKSIEHLIKAVASDVTDAVKENEAILDLAVWLYKNGDLERAYKYILYALNDANSYHINYRYSLLTEEFKTITNAYQQQAEKQYSILKYFVIILILLLIGLTFSLWRNQKNKKNLALAQKGLDEKNRSLEELTFEQDKLIRELSESNHTKEEYISRFIDLYSHYISKFDDYRKMIYNKIKVKRFDDLLKMTDSSLYKPNEEVKELYSHFDQAFLAIYPGFVEAINKMLKEGERFELKQGELNRELRIFALIRLGITDTSQIAKFLRCSIQTIYNYRSRIRKRSIDETEDIEERIKQIGRY